VALRGTRAIELDAAKVGREQLTMARLLNDVQAGQNTMAAILHQLAPGQDSLDRDKLIHDLEAADTALARVAASRSDTLEAAQWRELEEAVRAFSRGVREAVFQRGPRTAFELVPLFGLHDRVVRVEQQLFLVSERRMKETERASKTPRVRSLQTPGCCSAPASCWLC
jgi:hypothetical protein